MTDTLRSILYSLVMTTQIISPGMYVFHEVSFFNAIKSPGMMIGASELPLLKHMKLKSPAMGKETGTSLPHGIG